VASISRLPTNTILAAILISQGIMLTCQGEQASRIEALETGGAGQARSAIASNVALPRVDITALSNKITKALKGNPTIVKHPLFFMSQTPRKAIAKAVTIFLMLGGDEAKEFAKVGSPSGVQANGRNLNSKDFRGFTAYVLGHHKDALSSATRAVAAVACDMEVFVSPEDTLGVAALLMARMLLFICHKKIK
jgi:hypothetical protein